VEQGGDDDLIYSLPGGLKTFRISGDGAMVVTQRYCNELFGGFMGYVGQSSYEI
jgi:hypothetical protein